MRTRERAGCRSFFPGTNITIIRLCQQRSGRRSGEIFVFSEGAACSGSRHDSCWPCPKTSAHACETCGPLTTCAPPKAALPGGEPSRSKGKLGGGNASQPPGPWVNSEPTLFRVSRPVSL